MKYILLILFLATALNCKPKAQSVVYNIVCFSTSPENDGIQATGTIIKNEDNLLFDVTQNGVDFTKDYTIIEKNELSFSVKESPSSSESIITITKTPGVINYIYNNKNSQPFAMYNGYFEVSNKGLNSIYFFYQ